MDFVGKGEVATNTDFNNFVLKIWEEIFGLHKKVLNLLLNNVKDGSNTVD